MKSIFNEKRYLNEDTNAIEYFKQWGIKYRENVERSIENNQDAIEDYNVYLDNIVEALLDLRLESSLDYSIALGYLINKGYLSEGFKFDSKEPEKEIIGKLGISILQGSGCCRNICDMHKDILERLNMNSIPFYCYQGISFFDKGYNREANHVINLIEYNDNLYGIDLYNGTNLYCFKDALLMKSISTEHDELLRYKPYCEIIIDGRNIEDIKNRIQLFSDYSEKESINSFEYEMIIRDDIENHLFENREKLNDFNNKNKVLIRKINSKCVK